MRSQPPEILAGTVRVERAKLVAETNSRKRAAALRKNLEQAAPGLLTHVRRSETNPRAANEREARRPGWQRGSRQGLSEALEVPPEAREVLRARSPRAAVATAEGRRKVDLLLKEADYDEGRLDLAEPFDFRPLRRTLGV